MTQCLMCQQRISVRHQGVYTDCFRMTTQKSSTWSQKTGSMCFSIRKTVLELKFNIRRRKLPEPVKASLNQTDQVTSLFSGSMFRKPMVQFPDLLFLLYKQVLNILDPNAPEWHKCLSAFEWTRELTDPEKPQNSTDGGQGHNKAEVKRFSGPVKHWHRNWTCLFSTLIAFSPFMYLHHSVHVEHLNVSLGSQQTSLYFERLTKAKTVSEPKLGVLYTPFHYSIDSVK